MIRWPRFAAMAMITLTAAAVTTAPARAQQQQAEPAALAAPAPQADAATPATQDAGPRINTMERAEPRFNTPVRHFAQDDVNINRSYLIYVLVAAVLVVLLVFLIKRA